mmetsp:Transcript_6990/g.21282  ORF Transcript_6990/g.21282 Transcript_6990/m.21282 type:complete len:302 (+) Transcript_6990:380-1285(+)
MADVLLYLVRMADKCGVNLSDAVLKKLAKNAEKYPANLARGNAAKYTAYAGQLDEDNREEEETEESELGKKSYWDEVYSSELQAFLANGCEGEDWFSSHTGRGKLAGFVAETINRIWPDQGERQLEVLDIGCGNAMFLMELAKDKSFTGLLGVDYAQSACDVASAMKARLAETLDGEERNNILKVCFKCMDMFSLKRSDFPDGFSLIHDKGTLDAIYLSRGRQMPPLRDYIAKVKELLKRPGVYIITSCNLTRDELSDLFKPDFEVCNELPHPSIEFGGSSGSAIVTLAFQEMKEEPTKVD